MRSNSLLVSILFVLIVVSSTSAPVYASDCEVVINSNDLMQFDKGEIRVSSSCASVSLTLNHTGSLPAAAMGHNWVLTKSADFNSVAQAAVTAGLENNYIPDDERVLASTAIIGGGETTKTTVDLSTLSKDEAYTFFCSFPGHWAIMKGSFKVT